MSNCFKNGLTLEIAYDCSDSWKWSLHRIAMSFIANKCRDLVLWMLLNETHDHFTSNIAWYAQVLLIKLSNERSSNLFVQPRPFIHSTTHSVKSLNGLPLSRLIGNRR
jgi:hypothetical protein